MSRRCLIISGGEYHPITGVGPEDFIIACDRGCPGNTQAIVKLARARERRGLMRVENLGETL